MKTGKSLTQLAQELERRAANKIDMVADTRQLHMTDDAQLSIREGAIARTSDKTLPVNKIAHNQIAARLDIPAKYYDRMLKETPQLLAENVNTWLHGNPEKRLVRTLDGNVRAFLSDRYQRIENEQIASVVLPILLREGADVRIESAEITDSRMYIKAVFPSIQQEVSPGDIVQSGIVISNSEVGQGAVKIEPLVYRLVCTNGLIVNDASLLSRHVGGRISKEEHLLEILSDEAIRADDTAIMLKIRDVVRASFDDVHFGTVVEKMRAAKDDQMKSRVNETVKVLSKKHSLTEFEGDTILRHLIEGADLSRYGLLNAVTRSAQDMESYDRATELETLGGTILEMTRNQWKEFALAA